MAFDLYFQQANVITCEYKSLQVIIYTNGQALHLHKVRNILISFCFFGCCCLFSKHEDKKRIVSSVCVVFSENT